MYVVRRCDTNWKYIIGYATVLLLSHLRLTASEKGDSVHFRTYRSLLFLCKP